MLTIINFSHLHLRFMPYDMHALQGSKLAKLVWKGISNLVWFMFSLLSSAFLSIMSMPTAAFEHPFWKIKKRLSNLKPTSKEVNCSVDGCKELGDISPDILVM